MSTEEVRKKRGVDEDSEPLGGDAKRRKKRAADDAADDSDSDDEVLPAVARLLADSDAESSSSVSSSSSEEEDEEAAPVQKKAKVAVQPPDTTGTPAGEAAAPKDTAAPKEAAGAPAPASPASDSSSSSSSESESESEAEEAGPVAASETRSEAPEPQELQVAEINRFDLARRALLKRDELAKLLSDLPAEVAEEAVVRCFVRLAVQAAPSDTDSAACVLAEVVGLEPSPPYVVHRSDGERNTLRFRLRCKRGASQRIVKVSAVSNRELLEAEHLQWQRLIERTGVEPSMYVEQMMKKADDINRARNFKFDDMTVSKLLAAKGNLEFDAQRESRVRFLVQCAMSQMDTSGSRDYPAEQVERKYKDALDQLRLEQEKSARVQAEWFDKRGNLFSLKMINKKNYERQVRDDRHALDFTLATEEAGTEGINPFQRRACRPSTAWDTKLTSDGVTSTENAAAGGASGGAAPEASAAAPQGTAPSTESTKPVPEATCLSEAERFERFLKAQSSARHILAGLMKASSL